MILTPKTFVQAGDLKSGLTRNTLPEITAILMAPDGSHVIFHEPPGAFTLGARIKRFLASWSEIFRVKREAG
jgi:hypothetical protein